MSRKTNLHPDDRNFLHAIIRVERARQPEYGNAQIASVVSEVLREKAPYDDQVERTNDSLLFDAVYSHVEVVAKQEKVRISFRDTSGKKRTVSLPLNVGVEIPSVNGGPATWTQLPFVGLPWEEFERVMFREEQVTARQNKKMDAIRAIWRLRSVYPNTLTPREAIEAAGLDLSNLDLVA